MHRHFALSALIACSLSPGLALAQDDGLQWLDNYKEALRQAKQSGKPIFLEYRCEP